MIIFVSFLQEIMMDHSLRSISYIADIGDLLVIMARRRIMPQDGEELQVIGSTPKMICHVFESEEVRIMFPFPFNCLKLVFTLFISSNFKLQSNLAIRNGLIRNKLVLRNHFLRPICHLLKRLLWAGVYHSSLFTIYFIRIRNFWH